MRLFILLLAFVFTLSLFAQEGGDLDQQEQVDEVITEEPDSTDAPKDQTIHVECNCPPNEIQAEEAAPTVNSIFPSGSVFLVSPEATTPSGPVQKEEEHIPGYVEKLQRGYSDDSYKQILRD